MLFPLLLITSALASPSTCEISAADLASVVSGALDDYAQVREQSFTANRLEANEKLGCLTDQAPQALIGDLHLLKALNSFIDGDKNSTKASFRALLALEPSYQLPASIAPTGHPFQRLFVEARKATAPSQRDLIDPVEGALLLDGVQSTQRSLQRAALVQWVNAAGTPCWSTYLQPNQSVSLWVLAYASEAGGLDRCIEERRLSAPPPAVVEAEPFPDDAGADQGDDGDFFADLQTYMDPIAPPDGAAVEKATTPMQVIPEPTQARSGSPLLRPLPIATVGTGLAAGGMLAAALVTRAKLLDTAAECSSAAGCDRSDDEVITDLEAMEQRTNLLGYGAQAAGGLAVGLGVLSLTVSF